MLSKLDIALLCDSRTVDAAGNAITPDRSRHGIHAQLGDGGAAATMPTLDALNGRMTFDGGDYMVLRAADDVAGVLAGMGSIQDETYLFYFDPFQAVVAPNLIEPFSSNDGANPRVIFRYGTANMYFLVAFYDAGGGGEASITPNNSIQEFFGKQLLLAITRRNADTDTHIYYANGARRWASNVAPRRDASSAKNYRIGSSLAGAFFLPAGTGLRFFGYAREAWTQTQLRALQRFLRGNL